MIPQFMTTFDIDCRMSGLGDLIVRIAVGNEKVSGTVYTHKRTFDTTYYRAVN